MTAWESVGHDQPPLIVGAGPVGLAAALFLTRRGHKVRIVEAATAPSSHSKALAINPRTLELLRASGVTSDLLERGMPIVGARIHHRGCVLADLPFGKIHQRYPFMLALSQASTERLLERAAEADGCHVERGVTLVKCSVDNMPEVVLKDGAGRRETVRAPWVFAADGAHSLTREQLHLTLDGSSLQEPWHLVDVPLETELADDHAHVLLLDKGRFLFLLRVIDDASPATQAPLWRLLGNFAPLLPALEASAQHVAVAGDPVWESAFHVSHRVCSRMAEGGFYLAGDAAHVHSPVGARGMNLGIEDAWVFAQLALRHRLDEYAPLRRPVDARVVKQVERISKLAAPASRWRSGTRVPLFAALGRFPPARARMLHTLSGLDHPLPFRLPKRRRSAFTGRVQAR